MSSTSQLAPSIALALLASLAPALPGHAVPQTFEAGSVIIPMDTDHQDLGMLEAFGLVYRLLENGVAIEWCIAPGKVHEGVDFTASATDHVTSAPIVAHGYRGGPFVVSAEDAALALPVIDAWLATHPEVAVHVASDSFDAEVARTIILRPRVAVLVDGREDFAFSYLNAAGIPDALGQPWPAALDGSGAYPAWPDILDGAEVVGPTTAQPRDGALFATDGGPDYCMLFAGLDAEGVSDFDDVMSEISEFARTPAAIFAGYRAAVHVENHPAGRFLTSNGIKKGEDANGPIDHYVADVPVAQADGEAEGREAEHGSYTLENASVYYDDSSALASVEGEPIGDSDWLISGYTLADSTLAVVTYLGGKGYPTDVPISANPRTQGTRFFLNAVLESVASIPPTDFILGQSAPASSPDGPVTIEVAYSNGGPEIAENVVVRLPIPAGFSFVSTCCGGVLDGTDVVWSLGDVQVGASGTLEVAITAVVPPDVLTIRAHADYRRACAHVHEVGPETNTLVDGDTIPDPVDNCVDTPNPDQLDSDGDGAGDVCDPCPFDALDDGDDDGLCADVDNCPADANADQDDADGDGLGDACDPCRIDPDNDAEGDGHCADVDNCPDDANADQADADGDGPGDACDPCPLDALDDVEGDGHCADVDNCPDDANADQADADGDGAGDVCDPCPFDALDDVEGDGHCADVDNCPDDANADQADADGDGAGDVCDPCPFDALDDAEGDGHCADVDNCPDDANAGQADADGDGQGDACDPCPLDALDDVDADGHCADVDNCPTTPNPGQADSDGDGLGNACDDCPFDPANDADGDGRCADVDNCPTSWNPRQDDADGDGAGDSCDPCPLDLLDDADGDGHCANEDNCPDVTNPGQEDPDADGTGSACDPCPFDASDDSDRDGWCADVDNCPSTPNPGQEDEDGNGVGDACECGTTFLGPPTDAVVGLRPTPDKRLIWQPMADADRYLVLRGTLPEGGTLLTRPTVYDHDCRARVTTAGFVELDSPPVGATGYGAFYYLVLASNPCGDSDSGLGTSSFGVARPVPVCP